MSDTSIPHPTICYQDDYDMWSHFNRELVHVLPLKDLEWSSKSKNGCDLSVPTLPIVWKPQTELVEEIEKHINASEKKLSAAQSRADTFSAASLPYCHVYIVHCEDLDTYKQLIKSRIKEWLSRINALQNIGAGEWLILYVSLEDRKTPLRIDFAQKLFGKIYDRLRNDFNPKNRNRCCQLKLYTEAEGRLGGDQWSEFQSMMQDCIISSFESRIASCEDQVRHLMASRFKSGWNLADFASIKETQATLYMTMSLHEESLLAYDELEAVLVEKDIADIEWPVFGNSDVEDSKISLLDLSRGDAANSCRDHLIVDEWTYFGFWNYLYARQAQLLLLLEAPAEVASRGRDHLKHCNRLLSHLDSPEDTFAGEWVYVSALDIVQSCGAVSSTGTHFWNELKRLRAIQAELLCSARTKFCRLAAQKEECGVLPDLLNGICRAFFDDDMIDMLEVTATDDTLPTLAPEELDRSPSPIRSPSVQKARHSRHVTKLTDSLGDWIKVRSHFLELTTRASVHLQQSGRQRDAARLNAEAALLYMLSGRSSLAEAPLLAFSDICRKDGWINLEMSALRLLAICMKRNKNTTGFLSTCVRLCAVDSSYTTPFLEVVSTLDQPFTLDVEISEQILKFGHGLASDATKIVHQGEQIQMDLDIVNILPVDLCGDVTLEFARASTPRLGSGSRSSAAAVALRGMLAGVGANEIMAAQSALSCDEQTDVTLKSGVNHVSFTVDARDKGGHRVQYITFKIGHLVIKARPPFPPLPRYRIFVKPYECPYDIVIILPSILVPDPDLNQPFTVKLVAKDSRALPIGSKLVLSCDDGVKVTGDADVGGLSETASYSCSCRTCSGYNDVASRLTATLVLPGYDDSIVSAALNVTSPVVVDTDFHQIEQVNHISVTVTMIAPARVLSCALRIGSNDFVVDGLSGVDLMEGQSQAAGVAVVDSLENGVVRLKMQTDFGLDFYYEQPFMATVSSTPFIVEAKMADSGPIGRSLPFVVTVDPALPSLTYAVAHSETWMVVGRTCGSVPDDGVITLSAIPRRAGLLSTPTVAVTGDGTTVSNRTTRFVAMPQISLQSPLFRTAKQALF